MGIVQVPVTGVTLGHVHCHYVKQMFQRPWQIGLFLHALPAVGCHILPGFCYSLRDVDVYTKYIPCLRTLPVVLFFVKGCAFMNHFITLKTAKCYHLLKQPCDCTSGKLSVPYSNAQKINCVCTHCSNYCTDYLQFGHVSSIIGRNGIGCLNKQQKT